MIKELDLENYKNTYPCVRSGYCCKKAPCCYGESISSSESRCKYLEEDKPLNDTTMQYKCGRFEWIMQNIPEEAWKISPAFGEGCSSPLFNTDRNRILAIKRKEKLND